MMMMMIGKIQILGIIPTMAALTIITLEVATTPVQVALRVVRIDAARPVRQAVAKHATMIVRLVVMVHAKQEANTAKHVGFATMVARVAA